LAAHDVGASLAFYEKLGLRESFRLNYPDGSLMLVYLYLGGDRFIEIFPNGPEPDANRVHSFRHICLFSADLRADLERLRQQGIEIEIEPKEGLDYNLQAWIRDPDGNAIELMQISEDSPQWRTAHAAEAPA